MFIVIVRVPVCDVISFEIYLNFLIKWFFPISPKRFGQICKHIKYERAFKIKQKPSLIIFKWFLLNQIKRKVRAQL